MSFKDLQAARLRAIKRGPRGRSYQAGTLGESQQRNLEALEYFQQHPTPYSRDYQPPELTRRGVEQRAMGTMLDVADPFATAAREYTKYKGGTPAEQLAAEVGVGAVSPGLGEFTGPLKATGAVLLGHPGTVKVLQEGLERIMQLAPESRMAKLAEEAITSGDVGITGFRNLPTEITEEAARLGAKEPYGALWGTDVEDLRTWVDLERAPGETVRTGAHEGTHALWRRMIPEEKAGWTEAVEAYGAHPSARRYEGARAADESLASTIEDFTTPGSQITAPLGLVRALEKMTGEDLVTAYAHRFASVPK